MKQTQEELNEQENKIKTFQEALKTFNEERQKKVRETNKYKLHETQVAAMAEMSPKQKKKYIKAIVSNRAFEEYITSEEIYY